MPTPDPARLEEQPVYLTAKQVGQLVQLSAKSIYRLAEADATFPVARIGGSLRFPRDRVLRWLRDREQGRPQLQAVRTTERSA